MSVIALFVVLIALTSSSVYATTSGVSCGSGSYAGEFCGTSAGPGKCDGAGNCAVFTTFCTGTSPCAYGSAYGAANSVDVTQSGNGATNHAAECVLNSNTVAAPYFCAYSSCSGQYAQALCAFPTTGSIQRQVGTCTGSSTLTCAIGVRNALGTAVINGCAANNAPAGTPCLYGLTDAANSASQCTTTGQCGVVSCPYNGATCNTAPNTATGSAGTCSPSGCAIPGSACATAAVNTPCIYSDQNTAATCQLVEATKVCTRT